MPQPGGRLHDFGPFRYDADQRLLFRGGELVPLAPKALDTLHVLIERRGRVVEKDELRKFVWPDTTVEDVGLPRNISLLRKALGGDPETYIETIPKRGYRFRAAAAAPRRRWAWLAVPAAVFALAGLVYWQFYAPSGFLPRGPGYASLVTIPFQPLSAGLEQSGIPFSFNELLVTELTRIERVYVVSPGTVRRYQWVGIGPQIMARLLAADVILDGTVQRVAGALRVTVHLADVHSGKLVWAETYEQTSADAALARQIASEVGVRLSEGFKKN
ncbi:MAG: winged helix-turn-helix domain-containing protein [Bryobacterales bacterium]|nr:winged helix-turn-helix domain-containing protein [Bryobacterales bacterium]